MKKFDFWYKWLLYLTLLIVVFGLLMTLLSQSAVFEPMNRQINDTFWQTTPVSGATIQFQQWIYGVLGATMTGWGILMYFVVKNPFKNREKWAWNALLVAIVIWYCVDTSISIYSKVYFNAVFNTVLLILTLFPLIFTSTYFSNHKNK